jgi:hypothetical protein
MVDDPENGPQIKAEAASYVADLTADLARIARRHGLDTLGYILDMARLEAQNAAGKGTSESSEIN